MDANKINYKFGEGEQMKSLMEHINKTYDKDHYYANSPMFFIGLDPIVGANFAYGNVIKYANRAGKKMGESAHNDILKAHHYLFFMKHFLRQAENKTSLLLPTSDNKDDKLEVNISNLKEKKK